jgi:two-component system sensor kinase FixL
MLPATTKQRLTQHLTATAIALALLLAPLLLTHWFGRSAYLFGMGAVLICALWARLPSLTVVGSLTLVVGLYMDRHAGLAPAEVAARAVVFLLLTVLTGWRTESIRRHQRASSETITDLASKDALLRTIEEIGPDAILVFNERAQVLSFSSAAEILFGWSADEVIGRNISLLMPSHYGREHDGHVARYVETGEGRVIGQSRRVHGLRKDGSQFPMMLHLGEVMLGGERCFTGLVHDLTDLTEAQERSEELRDQLTHVWRLNSLGEIASVLAHELNQPLTAIANYSRAARTIVSRLELTDDDLLEALEETGAQAIRAGEIIRRTRAMVSREHNEQQIISLKALILEMEMIINMLAREASVSVSYDFEDGPDEVQVDRIQIQQVLGNLARNAFDAMRAGAGGRLEIGTRKTSGGWIVRLSDSGPGLAPHIANRLFEPLVSGKTNGMGLGLSISKTIIDHHHGEIWVERSRYGGAAFCFMLPS